MPMIDVYATAGTFADKHQLAVALATTLMPSTSCSRCARSTRVRTR